MSDSLPGLSGDMGAGKPLTRAEFAKRERERHALQLFIEGKTYAQIKNAMNLRNSDAARELVEKGEQRWANEELRSMVRYVAMQRSDLARIRDMLMRRIVESDDLAAADRMFKLWERFSKLFDLDQKKEEKASGDTYVLAAGDVNMVVPPGARQIDARKPWEREGWVEPQADVEGEVIDHDKGAGS